MRPFEPDFSRADREAEEDKPPGKAPKALHIEALGQVAPGVPLRWLDVPDGDWPYRTPEEEFVRSPFPLDLQVLGGRWEGLWTRADIEDAYARNRWRRARFDWQRQVAAQSKAQSLAQDSAFQQEVLERDIVDFSHLRDLLLADIEAGVEFKPVRGGGEFGYVKMPLTADSKNKLANAAIAVSNLLATRVGLATEIAELRGGEGAQSLHSRMRDVLAQHDPEFAALLAAAGLGGRIFESSAHQLEEGGGRIFDATDQPLSPQVLEGDDDR